MHNIKIEHHPVFLKKDEGNLRREMQTYFLDYNASPILLFPLRTWRGVTLEDGSRHDYLQETLNQIKDKVLDNKNGKIVLNAHGQFLFETKLFKEEILHKPVEAGEWKNIKFASEDNYITTEDIIIKVNSKSDLIDVWSLKDYENTPTFIDMITSTKNQDNKTLFNQVLS